MPRHFTFRIGKCLAAGLVTTIAIAWGSALVPMNLKGAPAKYANGPILTWNGRWMGLGAVARRDSFTCTRFYAGMPMPLTGSGQNGWPPVHPEVDWWRGDFVPDWVTITPPWARSVTTTSLHQHPDNRKYAREWDTFEAHGWPWRALVFQEHGWYDHTNGFAHQIAGGLSVPHPQNPELTTWRGYGVVLPYRPIWPGLLANTAIFATPWAVLLFGVPLMRRTTRRQRGRCVRCGYDLRGTPTQSPCPECGRPRT